MKLFRFDHEVGKVVEAYNSSGFIISGVAHSVDEVTVNGAFLAAGGVIGYHQALTAQLFLILQGEGWVRGESPEKISIKSGQAAYWEKDEWHGAGTETGMTAMIIEGNKLDIARLTPLA